MVIASPSPTPAGVVWRTVAFCNRHWRSSPPPRRCIAVAWVRPLVRAAFEVGADVLDAFSGWPDAESRLSNATDKDGKWLADLPHCWPAACFEAGGRGVRCYGCDECTYQLAERLLFVPTRRSHRPHGQSDLDRPLDSPAVATSLTRVNWSAFQALVIASSAPICLVN